MALDKLIAAQKKQLTTIAAQQVQLTPRWPRADELDQVSQNIDDCRARSMACRSGRCGPRELQRPVVQEDELQSQLDNLQAEEQVKQVELTQRQQILAARLIAAYKTDQTPLLTSS